jgi:hypothetical protein
MFPLITPSIGRSHIPIAFHSLPTTPPKRLIPRPLPNPLNLGTLIIMANRTTPIVILDVEETLVTARAVEEGWRGES